MAQHQQRAGHQHQDRQEDVQEQPDGRHHDEGKKGPEPRTCEVAVGERHDQDGEVAGPEVGKHSEAKRDRARRDDGRGGRCRHRFGGGCAELAGAQPYRDRGECETEPDHELECDRGAERLEERHQDRGPHVVEVEDRGAERVAGHERGVVDPEPTGVWQLPGDDGGQGSLPQAGRAIE